MRECQTWAIHRRDEKRIDMMSFRPRWLLMAALAVFLACHAYAAAILMRGERPMSPQAQLMSGPME